MTLKEAYESVESNYDNVLKRLGSDVCKSTLFS